jgi:GNAT superfamily N-acetyltransferase
MPPPTGIRVVCKLSPFPEGFAEDVVALLDQPHPAGFGEQWGHDWGQDLLARSVEAGTIMAVAVVDAEPNGSEITSNVVAHVMITFDVRAKPLVGLVGHVFTAPTHRRQGLSNLLLGSALRRFDAEGTAGDGNCKFMHTHTHTAPTHRLLSGRIQCKCLDRTCFGLKRPDRANV